VSWATGAHAEQPTYRAPDRRTVAEIQKKIAIQGKRIAISRTFYARNEKVLIVAWGRDLDRILNIFNVSTVDFFWRYLKVSLSDGAVIE
jgi:hypothetical protein